MTPMTTTDPQQAQMMKFMPISMAVMFVFFRSQAVWRVYSDQQFGGYLQQWYLNRTHPLPAPAKLTRAKN